MTRATTFRATAVIGGVLLAMLMIMTVSRAAFIDTTENTGNAFAAGNVVLTDNDADTAMFSVSPMAPDQTETRCINVTYSGNLSSDVLLSSLDASGSTSQAFADVLDIQIFRGATATGAFPYDGPGDSCTGGTEITAAGEVLGDYTTAGGFSDTWSPDGITDHTETYRFVVHFQDTTDNALQNQSAAFDVTWTATSN